MSRSAGTGQPVRFKCSRCRKRDRSTRFPPPSPWEVTGESRASFTGSNAGGRSDPTRVYGYRCLRCGYQGWSRHIDVQRAVRREEQRPDARGAQRESTAPKCVIRPRFPQ